MGHYLGVLGRPKKCSAVSINAAHKASTPPEMERVLEERNTRNLSRASPVERASLKNRITPTARDTHAIASEASLCESVMASSNFLVLKASALLLIRRSKKAKIRDDVLDLFFR